jgi:hypothetical protein
LNILLVQENSLKIRVILFVKGKIKELAIAEI